MNDRFRFRIWNPDLQSYDDNRDYNVAILVNQDFGLILNPYRDNIIEMCTGLKDKNGNLIYEGDLLGVFPVVWVNELNGFRVKVNTFHGWDWHYINEFTNQEITGNIHEQAEQKDK